MGARVLFIASISTVFLILSNAGFAQDESAGGLLAREEAGTARQA